MAATEMKTVPTGVEVDRFISSVGDERQREDARAICTMMTRLSGHPAAMWGPSIIGFGTYRYRYESGREGEMCRVGFSPRKGQTVIYLIDGYAGKDAQLAKLGKHKIGKSCLYIKKLSEVDQIVLEAMIADSLAYMAKQYPE